MEDAQRREIALFRYALVRQCADPELTSRQRGRLVRDLAGRDHVGWDGQRRRVARSTLDEWIRAYRTGGFDALIPAAGSRQPRTSAQLLALAVSLKEARPGGPDRRADPRGHARRRAPGSVGPHDPAALPPYRSQPPTRRQPPQGVRPVRGRGRQRPVDRRRAPWPGDRWPSQLPVRVHRRSQPTGPWVSVGPRRRLAAARSGVPARAGRPRHPPPAVRRQRLGVRRRAVAAACAVLGIQLVHSRPGEPAGRGKIERFFRTVRDQFLIEVDTEQVTDLEQVNRLFVAWVEQRYHRRIHTETGATPLQRFTDAGPIDLPFPELLAEAFLWAEDRTVTTTALVSLHGNRYQVDPALIGRKVQLVFDPFDLTDIQVRFNNQSFGRAAPHVLGAHVHPRATNALAEPDDMTANPGIDYLALVAAEHAAATRKAINFADLTPDDATTTDDGDGDEQEGAA